MRLFTAHIAALTMAAIMAMSCPARARVAKIIVDRTVALPDGVNESLTGRAFGELDPEDPVNAVITDIALAPRDSRGRVGYVAKFTLTKPRDLAKTSGVLWYDVVNRGKPVRRMSVRARSDL